MKDRNGWKTTTLAVCLVGLSSCDAPNGGRIPQGGVASASDAAMQATVQPAEGLQLVLGTEKAEYVLGEPVYATVVLTNTGQAPQRVVRTLRPEDEVLSLLVTGPDGQERPFRPMGRADHDQTAWTDLAPGGQLGVTVAIFFGADGWTFTVPGEYRVAARYTWGGGETALRRVESEPATFRVTADEAGSRLTSGDAASLEAGKLLLWQAGDHLVAGREMLTGLASTAGSVLASHAGFALGRSMSEPFSDYGAGEVRAADCAEAGRWLDQVVVEDLGTQSRALVAIARARCAAEQGDRVEALARLALAQEVVEGRPELQDLALRIQEYRNNLGDDQG